MLTKIENPWIFHVHKILMRISWFGQAIFLERFNSHVGRIVDYSFAFFSTLEMC
jgi:hypothetical protein